jgi:hypothetical protein
MVRTARNNRSTSPIFFVAVVTRIGSATQGLAACRKTRYTGPIEMDAKEARPMTAHQIDVADMQCWVFRMAQTQWKIPPAQCAKIFQENNVFGYLEDCYDVLHLSSYQCALDDVETLLRKRGAFPC